MIRKSTFQNNFVNNIGRPVIILMVALFCLSGCARVYHAPVLNYESADWFEIARATELNFSRLHSLKGRARLSFEMPNMAQNVSAEIRMILPDSLRIKFEAIFGIDVALLIADKDSVQIYSPFQKALYVSPTDSLDLSRFFPIDLTFKELLSAFTGIEQVTDSCRIQRKADQLICYMPRSFGASISYIDPELGVITRSDQVNRDGKILLKREYKRFEKINGVIIPRTIRITRPHQQQRVTIFYSNLEINPILKPESFMINPAEKTTRVHLKEWRKIDDSKNGQH